VKNKIKLALILGVIFLLVLIFFLKIKNDHLSFVIDANKLGKICEKNADKTVCEYSIISSISTKEQAYWACLSFFTSFVGLIGIVVSLIYTAKANFLAQESIKQNKENLLIEQRPWIDIKISLNPSKKFEIKESKEVFLIYPIIQIKNIGLTAAEVISQEIVFVNGVFNTRDWINDKISDMKKGEKNDKMSNIYLPQDSSLSYYPIQREKSDFNKYIQGSKDAIAPSIAVIIVYKSIYNEKDIFHTARFEVISKKDRQALKLEDIPINNSDLIISSVVSNIK